MKPAEAPIIVVEDEMGARTTLCAILEDAGYCVIGLEKGSAAMEMIRQRSFEAIITDIRLPDVGGMEILELAKEINPDAAVIMITGYASVETAVDAVNQGAFAYFVKPVNPDEIKTAIANALKQRRLSQENKRLVEKKDCTLCPIDRNLCVGWSIDLRGELLNYSYFLHIAGFENRP